ncbi:MAG: hypothetical protein GEU91_17675 [Rhizobiales bacterium]|nr:hypothetical protein [Hyphomicrobiales bacterium]
MAIVATAVAMLAADSANAQTSRSQAERIALLMHNVAPPQQVAAALSPVDRKYNSAGCREARKHAEAYEDMTGQRAALAVGASVALALVGSPVLLMPSPTAEGGRRLRHYRALLQHCVSNMQHINAATNELKKRLDIESQDRMAGTTRYEPTQ